MWFSKMSQAWLTIKGLHTNWDFSQPARYSPGAGEDQNFTLNVGGPPYETKPSGLSPGFTSVSPLKSVLIPSFFFS